MRFLNGLCTVFLLIGAAAVRAQAPVPAPATEPATSQPVAAAPATATGQEAAPGAIVPQTAPASASSSAASAEQVATAKKTYTVPAGDKVLLQLRAGINSKSAKPGDGVYLSSIFPVVVGSRVLIPAGVYVQGVIDKVARAGRVKGKAQVDMHFTSIIFPNGSLVEIPGVVNSVPGAKKQTVKGDAEGTIEQDSDKTRNMGTVAEIALPTGTTSGTIAGAAAGHPLAGMAAGLGGGLAAMALATVFTRGADLNLEAGTQVEMILQRPLSLEEENLSGSAQAAAPALAPAPNQPKPMEKPNRTRIFCPLGGLSCP